jgi:hypothetical protein
MLQRTQNPIPALPLGKSFGPIPWVVDDVKVADRIYFGYGFREYDAALGKFVWRSTGTMGPRLVLEIDPVSSSGEEVKPINIDLSVRLGSSGIIVLTGTEANRDTKIELQYTFNSNPLKGKLGVGLKGSVGPVGINESGITSPDAVIKLITRVINRL